MQKLTYKRWDSARLAEKIVSNKDKDGTAKKTQKISKINNLSTLISVESRVLEKSKKAKSENKRKEAKELLDFLHTAHYLATERLYDEDDQHAWDLAYHLAFGIGCDTDAKRAAELYAVELKRRVSAIREDELLVLGPHFKLIRGDEIQTVVNRAEILGNFTEVESYIRRIIMASFKVTVIYHKAIKTLISIGEITPELISESLDTDDAMARAIIKRMISDNLVREENGKWILDLIIPERDKKRIQKQIKKGRNKND